MVVFTYYRYLLLCILSAKNKAVQKTKQSKPKRSNAKNKKVKQKRCESKASQSEAKQSKAQAKANQRKTQQRNSSQRKAKQSRPKRSNGKSNHRKQHKAKRKPSKCARSNSDRIALLPIVFLNQQIPMCPLMWMGHQRSSRTSHDRLCQSPWNYRRRWPPPGESRRKAPQVVTVTGGVCHHRPLPQWAVLLCHTTTPMGRQSSCAFLTSLGQQFQPPKGGAPPRPRLLEEGVGQAIEPRHPLLVLGLELRLHLSGLASVAPPWALK